MDKEEKMEQLQELQNKINNMKKQMSELENDFKIINGFDVDNKLAKKKSIIDGMDKIKIFNDKEYICFKSVETAFDFDNMKCEDFERLKYYLSKFIASCN